MLMRRLLLVLLVGIAGVVSIQAQTKDKTYEEFTAETTKLEQWLDKRGLYDGCKCGLILYIGKDNRKMTVICDSGYIYELREVNKEYVRCFWGTYKSYKRKNPRMKWVDVTAMVESLRPRKVD